MFGTELSTIQLITIAIIPLLFAIVVHEVAHGWVARQLGDDTAYLMGRLTLNPLKHIDPVGTILVPLILILTVGFAFGWAKPVPVNFNNLRNRRRDTALVAVAGPFANLLMAIAWALIAKLASLLPDSIAMLTSPLILMSMFGMVINAILMVFNLIPIPPTDGGRIATSLLPPRLGYQLSRVEPYGLFIIVALLLSGVIWKLLDIVVQTVMQLIQFIL
ncbi:MAG: site-2 protease family protein [Gammaproteobacteria bacterium]|nr:site-2 protease family protein [Gammaproteobacteria bacterium]